LQNIKKLDLSSFCLLQRDETHTSITVEKGGEILINLSRGKDKKIYKLSTVKLAITPQHMEKVVLRAVRSKEEKAT